MATSSSGEEERRLQRVAENLVLKRVKTIDRLLDETALFLHSVEANLPEDNQRTLQNVRESDTALAGSKILIVDDDVRNIFALTSVLERKDLQVTHAENGRAAIEMLQKTPDIDIVLMDVMMPEMDGYETMRAIRRIESFRSLPIIALTAKAMKGDREKVRSGGRVRLHSETGRPGPSLLAAARLADAAGATRPAWLSATEEQRTEDMSVS